MIVPVGNTEVCVGVPSIANELDTGDLVLLVRVSQSFIKQDAVALDTDDPAYLQFANLIHADTDEGADMERLNAAQADLGGTCSHVGRQWLVLRLAESLAVAFVKHGEGSDRLLIGHAGNDTVGGLSVELHKVNVHIDLAGIEVLPEIGNLVGEDDICRIAHVHPQYQRNLQVVIGPNLGLFLMVNVDLTILIDYGS